MAPLFWRESSEVIQAATTYTLRVNGRDRSVTLPPHITLLDALREELGLVGTKKGCDHGQCGACTVLIEDRRIYSCLTLALMHADREITTIEGLGSPEALHPLQQAFVSQDALQCGYCTPGQIVSGVGFLQEARPESDDTIRAGMSGNLCRCGAYPQIVAAIRTVRDLPTL